MPRSRRRGSSRASTGGAQLGKRYADDDLGLELLCTKAGEGSISVGETVLEVKGGKALPGLGLNVERTATRCAG